MHYTTLLLLRLYYYTTTILYYYTILLYYTTILLLRLYYYTTILYYHTILPYYHTILLLRLCSIHNCAITFLTVFIPIHAVNFPCGRKLEHPEKTQDFQQSVRWLWCRLLFDVELYLTVHKSFVSTLLNIIHCGCAFHPSYPYWTVTSLEENTMSSITVIVHKLT
jgi:hypothetical protein